MVRHEHGYEHAENNVAVRRMVSSSIIYLEQLHSFHGSFLKHGVHIIRRVTGKWTNSDDLEVLTVYLLYYVVPHLCCSLDTLCSLYKILPTLVMFIRILLRSHPAFNRQNPNSSISC